MARLAPEDRISTLPHGTVDQLHRQLAGRLTVAEALKLHDNPDLWDVMFDALRADPAFKLVHGRFTPILDKIMMVKGWPAINPADVDAALVTATEDGTIAGYEAEVGSNPFLDIVVTVYRESIPATLVYARERYREAWGKKYDEWADAYAQNVNDDRVKAIAGAKPFIPNRIVIEVVDLAANWDRKNGVILEDVQKAQASQLADFAVIYNGAQSPKWIEQMDGEKVPYALVAALLLNVPGYAQWRDSPHVCRSGGKARLSGLLVGDRFYNYSMPVLREYRR